MDFDALAKMWMGTPEELLVFIVTRCTVDEDGLVSLSKTSQALTSFDEQSANFHMHIVSMFNRSQTSC